MGLLTKLHIHDARYQAITDIGDKFTYKINSVSPTNIDFDFYFLVEKQSSGKLVPAKHATPGEFLFNQSSRR